MRDVSDRDRVRDGPPFSEDWRRLEPNLRENERLLRVAARLVDMAVFSQDCGLHYTRMLSPQLGWATAEVLGRTDAELLPPADSGRITAIKCRVLETGLPAREEVTVTKATRSCTSISPWSRLWTSSVRSRD